MKKLTTIILSLILVLSCSAVSFAGDEMLISAQEKPAYDYNVMLNGEYIQFTDAQPMNKDGRIMVPFRIILESLGAEVDWNGETKTVTASLDDTVINFQVGGNKISIENDGQTSEKTMDVVPFINASNNRTYVSTRFVSEALGLTVGWDSEEKTAVIIDFDKIFENADEDFSVIDGYLTSQGSYDGNIAQTCTGTVKLSISKDAVNGMVGEEIVSKDIEASMNLNGSTVQNCEEMYMDMNAKMNLGGLKDLLKDIGMTDEDNAELISSFEKFNIKVYTDLKDIYINSDIPLFEDKPSADVWYRMNLAEYGLDLQSLMAQFSTGSYSMKDILEAAAATYEENMTVTTYDEVTATYESIKAILGNDSVTVKKSGKSTIYTISFDGLGDVLGFEGISGKIVITDKGNANVTQTGNIKVSLEGMIELSVDLSTSSSKTTKAVPGIPENSTIADMTSLIEIL